MSTETANWSLGHPFAIARTGKRPPYRFFRHPRNASIKRGLLGTVDSLRGEEVPPSNYDDISRSCERSWKRHRRTRWKEVAIVALAFVSISGVANARPPYGYGWNGGWRGGGCARHTLRLRATARLLLCAAATTGCLLLRLSALWMVT